MKHVNMIVGLVLGALIWALSPALTGFREPWDGSLAYYFGGLFLAGVISTVPSPRQWWRGPLGVYLGQYIFILIAHGGLGNLWPMSLLLGVVFSIPAWIGSGIVLGLWHLKGRVNRMDGAI